MSAVADCVFCEIVSKTRTADVKYEDDDFIVFGDIKPLAQIHYQVIPKVHIKDVDSLTKDHAEMIENMLKLGERITQRDAPDLETHFSFHRPPFTSVNHLHMHCLVMPLTGLTGFMKHTQAFWWAMPATKLLKRLKHPHPTGTS